MKSDFTPASVTSTAFSCPHCGAYTTQHWFKTYAYHYNEEKRTPTFPDELTIEKALSNPEHDEKTKRDLKLFFQKLNSAQPFFNKNVNTPYSTTKVDNCNISSCYNCKKLAIWVHDKMVYPVPKLEIEPNSDLPDHIKQLFNEAREIVSNSPKGAAALLRLCIQHLCAELGEKDKKIDKAIASLVSKGLNPMVQKALDIVRVIGNESVHPGEINLNDNRDIAIKLFELVNLISEQMISHPKQVEALYTGLPQDKLNGIEQRDKKSKQNIADPNS